jgi:hypothetical protein
MHNMPYNYKALSEAQCLNYSFCAYRCIHLLRIDNCESKLCDVRCAFNTYIVTHKNEYFKLLSCGNKFFRKTDIELISKYKSYHSNRL